MKFILARSYLKITNRTRSKNEGNHKCFVNYFVFCLLMSKTFLKLLYEIIHNYSGIFGKIDMLKSNYRVRRGILNDNSNNESISKSDI